MTYVWGGIIYMTVMAVIALFSLEEWRRIVPEVWVAAVIFFFLLLWLIHTGPPGLLG
jgi:hypothetical protein